MSIIINSADIEDILRFKISNRSREMALDFDMKFENLTDEEYVQYIYNVRDVLLKDIVYSGEHRAGQWDDGWRENLNLFLETKDLNLLIPKYHGKYNLLRWKGNVVRAVTKNLDYKLHICFVDAITDHYLKDCNHIWEFGCGPAYHLIRRQLSGDTRNLYGCDWAKSSQEIIEEVNKAIGTTIKGHNLDFFKPDYSIEVPENSGFYTVAALEQVGEKYKEFVDWILKKKPSIVVNIEPIDELLNPRNLLDFLSIMYFRKRKYLDKYLPYLEQLEKEGKIEIIKKQRTFTGSYFVDGHSLIVWRVKWEY